MRDALLRYSLYGTRDVAQNWKEEVVSTLSSLKLTRGSACPCVWRGHIKGSRLLEKSQRVECLIRMVSKRYEIKKQVIGEDPDFEKIWKNIESRHQVESQRFHS